MCLPGAEDSRVGNAMDMALLSAALQARAATHALAGEKQLFHPGSGSGSLLL